MYSILIVDDEHLTRSYMKENVPLINPLWRVTQEASDGQEALELAQIYKFDLIITDIKMPVMDGLTLCKILAEQFSNQRVIILSGYDEFTHAKEAIHYGVQEYLLKPIVKEELSTALERVTLDIERSKSHELSFKTMESLSHDLQSQFVNNFLKALISDNDSEIKVLYPLIYRLKVNLIQSEGTILILALDDDVYMSKDIPISDMTVFKFILNQITKELIEDEQLGKVFFDLEENTIVLVNSEDENDLLNMCKVVYDKVSMAIMNSTGLSITGAIGLPVSEVLQLNASYHKAHQVLLNRLVAGGNTIYSDTDDPRLIHSNQKLDKIISSLKLGLLDQNERVYLGSVKHFTELFELWTIPTLFRYGAFLIRSLGTLDNRFPMDTALNQLKVFGLTCHTNPVKNQIISLFSGIMNTFAHGLKLDGQVHDEHELVSKAKQYIYTHYSEPISLSLIAEVIGVSPSYLSSVFHHYVKESYIRFLTRVRMEEAAKLLQSRPPRKIVDVSELVGYVSVKHFSYVFKKYYHMPPGEYQDNYIKESM